MPINAVIMAGGSGTRFWPQSRKAMPKQLIPITSDKSMIQETIDRLKAFLPEEQIFVITNPEQAAIILDTVDGFKKEQIFIEPFGRDTAACVGLAAARLQAIDPDGVMCLLPADHVVKPVEAFAQALHTAEKVALDTKGFVTIGIKPTFPATSYGYIQRGEAQSEGVYAVQQFCEKPELAKAESFMASGEYYWNGGIFLWRVDVIMEAIATHMPALQAGLDNIMAAPEDDAVLEAEYGKFEKISVDYGIMEKVSPIYTVEATFNWDDVGSWSAVRGYYPPDENNNAARYENTVSIDANNNIVNVDGKKTVVLIDVDDLVVVDTDDAILICPASSDQKVKQALDALKDKGKENLL